MIKPGDAVTIAGSTFEIWIVLGSQPKPDCSVMLYRRDDQQRLRVVQVAPHLVKKADVEEYDDR